MCACAQPNINGQPGYRWQPADRPGTRPVDPPTLEDGDVLLYDEPGRCGGLDSHSHHYRLVLRYARVVLLVRHGGGEEAISLSSQVTLRGPLESLDSNSRYWLCNAIHKAHRDAERHGREQEALRWRTAAAEKRIKVRKVRGRDAVQVTIEEGS